MTTASAKAQKTLVMERISSAALKFAYSGGKLGGASSPTEVEPD